MSNWRAIITTFLGVALSGCAGVSVTQDLQPERRYKRDMSITVNGVVGKGVLVAKKDSEYKITLRTPDLMDALLIKTCHRESLIEGAGRSYQFNYVQTKGIEDITSCTMQLQGVTKKREKISLGFIDFSAGQTLPAKLNCSGVETNTDGASICQAPAGLTQQITFAEEVKFKGLTGECATHTQFDGKVLKFTMPNADCVIMFMGSSGRMHKTHWLGFDDYVLKE